MRGIVKRFDARGFGIINSADSSKVPFILSDVISHSLPEPGQKVVFSVRKVQGKGFAENVAATRDRLSVR
jgi:cold shock CspA family protein